MHGYKEGATASHAVTYMTYSKYVRQTQVATVFRAQVVTAKRRRRCTVAVLCNDAEAFVVRGSLVPRLK